MRLRPDFEQSIRLMHRDILNNIKRIAIDHAAYMRECDTVEDCQQVFFEFMKEVELELK